MPLEQIIVLIAPLFNGAGVALIFAGLFIWLFLATRKDEAARWQQARDDAAKADEQNRKDR